MAKKKTPPPTLITRQTGKVNTYTECLIEHHDGRREYVSGKEYEQLINGKNVGKRSGKEKGN